MARGNNADARRLPAAMRWRALYWLRQDAKRFARVWLLAEAAWWAFDLGGPWQTFPVSRVYNLLAAWMPEWAWAVLFGLDAALLLYGFRGGRLRRIASAGLDGLLHGVVVTSALVSAPGGTGVGTQTLLLCACYLLVEWEAMDG